MQLLILFSLALIIFSLINYNFPVKIYQYFFLRKLAKYLDLDLPRANLGLFGVAVELYADYRGRELKLKFLETTTDKLRQTSGLELRFKYDSQIVASIYHRQNRREAWGDFKIFATGNEGLDSQWLILTNDMLALKLFWEAKGQNWGNLMNNLTTSQPGMVILLNNDELIFHLRAFIWPERLKRFLDWLLEQPVMQEGLTRDKD